MEDVGLYTVTVIHFNIKRQSNLRSKTIIVQEVYAFYLFEEQQKDLKASDTALEYKHSN